MSRSKRIPATALLCAAAAAACGAGLAQTPAPSTQTQFLPEVDAFFKVSSSGRLLALAAYTDEIDATENQLELGLFWDQRVSDRVRIRGGYRYKQTDEAGDPPTRENRIQVSADVRLPVLLKTLATDRNMVELRWIEGTPSQRYRNRFTIEREVYGPLGKAFTAYAQAEVFYDTRHHSWNRQEYTAGASALVSQRLQVDVYYQRQNDSGGSPPHVNAAGITLTLYIDARRKSASGVVIGKATPPRAP